MCDRIFRFNPLTAEWALRALIDFTLSNARRFYSSMGNPLDGKGLRHRWAMGVATSDGPPCDFSANKLTIWMRRRYDFFFHLITALLFSNSESRAKTPRPDSFECFFDPQRSFGNPFRTFRQYFLNFSAIPCEPCSLKIETFSGTVKFSSLIRGDL